MLSSALRWLLLIWRYLAALAILPFAVALFLSVLLGAPGLRVWLSLALFWPVAVVLATVFLGGRQIAPQMVALGGILGMVAVIVPRLMSLPVLLTPFALILAGALFLGLWAFLGAILPGLGQRKATSRRRRDLSAATCCALPADEVMAEMRLAPDAETALHRCGPERPDGWFPIERKLPELRHDAPPHHQMMPWPLREHVARVIPLPASDGDDRNNQDTAEYARIIEDSRHDQTVAFSDGDGVSLSLLRICVTPRQRGCVVRETGWTNRLGLFDWLCATLQSHGLWTLASRLDHLAGDTPRYTPTDELTLLQPLPDAPKPEPTAHRPAQTQGGPRDLAALLRNMGSKAYARMSAFAGTVRSKQWR